MSDVVVYTIDSENMVIDQFECEREYAMENYWSKRTENGKYFIANVGDNIKYKFKRKVLKDVRHSSESEPSRL